MATTKTLTPTNQAITLAAFTEKPDNRTNVTNDDKLADAINALNSKMTLLDAPLTYQVSSENELKTTLTSIVDSMANGETRNIVLRFTAGVAPFGGGQWFTTIWKLSSTYFTGLAHTYNSNKGAINIKYSDGTWAFEELASKSDTPQLITVNQNLPVDSDYTVTLTNGIYLLVTCKPLNTTIASSLHIIFANQYGSTLKTITAAPNVSVTVNKFIVTLHTDTEYVKAAFIKISE